MLKLVKTVIIQVKILLVVISEIHWDRLLIKLKHENVFIQTLMYDVTVNVNRFKKNHLRKSCLTRCVHR